MEKNNSQNQEIQGGEKRTDQPTKTKKKKRNRRLIYSLSVIAILFLVIFPLLINFYADIIVGRTISEIVRMESNGKYELTFDDVGLNVFSRDISFKGVNLHPDNADSPKDSTNLISVQIPDLHLKGASWIRSVWKRELIIKQLSIHNPVVIYNGKKTSKDSLSRQINFDQNKLQTHIKRYLDLLKIESFELSQGSLTIDVLNRGIEEKFEFHDFSIRITEFHLDSVSQTGHERFFFSDSLGIRLDDGRFFYQRGPVMVNFSHLDISTGKDQLSIKNISFVQEKDSVNMLKFEIPELLVRGFQVQDIVEAENLKLDEIAFTEPNFLLNLHHRQQQHETSLDSLTQKIYHAVAMQFNSVEVKKITLSKAGLLIPKPSEKIGEIRVPDFDLTLHRLFIDSSSFETRRKFFFLDNVVFMSHGQSLALKDKGLEVSYGKLSFNSGLSRMRLNDVKIIKANPAPVEKLTMNFPEIKLVGKDFKNDLMARSVNLISLVLNNPELTLQMRPGKGKNKIDFQNLYPLIQGTLESIEIQDLRINSANIELALGEMAHPEIAVSGEFDFRFNQFQLDKLSTKRNEILYSGNVGVDGYNVKLDLKAPGYFARVDKLSADTRTSKMTLTGISIDTITGSNKPFAAVINSEIINLSGIDYNAIYHNKGYFVDSFEVFKPDITLIKNFKTQDVSGSNPAKQAPNYFLGRIKITRGQFRYVDATTTGNPIEVNQFDLLLDSLSPTAINPNFTLLDASLQGISVPLDDFKHVAYAGNLDISSADSTVLMKELSLNPIETYSGNQSLEVRLPQVLVCKIPLLEFYHDNALKAHKLLVDRPEVKISTRVHEMEPGSFHDFNPEIVKSELMKQFSVVSFDSLMVSEMDFITESAQDTTANTIALKGVNLLVLDFEVDESVSMTNENLLFASDISIIIDSVTRLSANKDRLTLSDFDLSTAGKSFSVKSIQYYSNDDMQNSSDAALDFGSISSGGIDYFELVVGKRISLDVLEIDRPDLVFNQKRKDKVRPSSGSQPLDLYEMISGHFHEVRAKDIRLNKLKLKITENERPHKSSYLFEQIDFRLKHILIDSSNRIFGNRFFYSEDLDFTIHNFRETSADSLYDFGASTIRFKSSNAILKVDSGYLHPNFSDSVFAARVGVQTDRLEFVFDSLTLNQFRLLDFIQDRSLYVGLAEVDGIRGNDYRSKLYPFPENHFPKLPASALKNLNFSLRIDTVMIRNSYFTYREYRPPALQPGEIWFSDINIQGRNITNDTASISRNQFMRFNASARLMGTAGLGLNLEFDLDHHNDYYRANGILNNFDMTVLNPILEHIAFVKVTKGRNHMLEFFYEADDDVAKGNMSFEYKKLHIRLIDKKTLRMRGFGETVASFIANTFVVRRNNPKFLIFKRKGDIYFSRDKQKSFFNYLTKSTLSGVNSTIRGVNEERKEKRRKREMERQVRKEGRLDDRYMRELNREKKSKSQPPE